MPLKDHKAELHAVSSIAGLIKYKAGQKLQATGRVALALQALIEDKKLREEIMIDAQTMDSCGVAWGEW